MSSVLLLTCRFSWSWVNGKWDKLMHFFVRWNDFFCASLFIEMRHFLHFCCHWLLSSCYFIFIIKPEDVEPCWFSLLLSFSRKGKHVFLFLHSQFAFLNKCLIWMVFFKQLIFLLMIFFFFYTVGDFKNENQIMPIKRRSWITKVHWEKSY